MAKRADAQKVERKRVRGSPRMRWENCVKRYPEKVGREWKTTATDRRCSRLLTEKVVREM